MNPDFANTGHATAVCDRRQPTFLKAVIFLLALLLQGCAQLPDLKTVTDPLAKAAAWDIVDHFEQTVPEQFQRIDSIVFTYSGRVLSFLGYSKINQRGKTFSVAGLTPVGIKLFEFSADAQSVKTAFVEKGLSKKGNVTEAIAGDIRRIYFDNIPSRNALIQSLPGLYVFIEVRDGYRIAYTFSTADGRLVRKRRIEGRKEVWNIAYETYWQIGEKECPQNIRYTHSGKNYELNISLKQYLPQAAGAPEQRVRSEQ